MVVQKLNAVQIAHDVTHGEDSVLMARIARLTNGFCDLATRVSGIVNILVPQSPEYTIAFGLLEIIFKVSGNKKPRSIADLIRLLWIRKRSSRLLQSSLNVLQRSYH